MILIRAAKDRGETRLDWLESHHSFSFADYQDPAHVDFGPLRVINEDHIAPGGGFRPHDHRDMEIITYMIDGALAHEDSMGNRFTIKAGEVQAMTAGLGISHSEVNASQTDPAHLLQIWLHPDREGYAPAYHQRAFGADEKYGRFCPIAAGPDMEGREDAVVIQGNAILYGAILGAGETLDYAPKPGRRIWVQGVAGDMAVNGTKLGASDGAGITDLAQLVFDSKKGCEFLLFDLD